jgi:CBS domain containing-hemolysin-like protein
MFYREAMEKIMARGHSRIPVYDGDKRNLIGNLQTVGMMQLVDGFGFF